MRVFLTKTNAATPQTQVVTVTFDHTKTQGGVPFPGIQDLIGWTASGNASISVAPVLTSASGDSWTYTFTVSMTGAAGVTGEIDFFARISARFGGR